MLKVRGLKKSYGNRVQALRGIDLEVPAGMFGLLGPNGAGKTTLMKILATLLEPDGGTAELNGIDLVVQKGRARRALGYLPQEFGFYPTLTAGQTLDYFIRLKGVTDARERRTLCDALLERVNLSSARGQKVGGFSGGMRQRLGIAQALVGQPELIIVDEPTAGLDPEERVRFHNLLSETASETAVVLLSTHIVSDVSNLCGRMAVIRKGEILASTTPSEAVRQLEGSIWEATVARKSVADFRSRCEVISSQTFDGKARLRVLAKGEPPGPDFTPAAPTLEDYYFGLVSRTAEGGR